MAVFTYGLGKGLREPVPPYRNDYVFGAELGDFNANDWNAIPTVWDPTTDFNLSTLTPGHEVVVALVGISGTSPGLHTIIFEWHRERDLAELFRSSFSWDTPAGGLLYAYSFIGYVPQEIFENGKYFCTVNIFGPDQSGQRNDFTVRGIPEAAPPAPVPGKFVDAIFSLVWDISTFFNNAYETVSDWVWPFYYLANPLYWIKLAFWNLLTPIAHFGDWVNDVADKVSDILGPEGIISLLRTWLTYAENAWSWISNAFSNVWNIIDTWWTTAKTTVQGWIDIAKQAVISLLDTVSKSLASLQTAWDNFRTITLPTLATGKVVSDLINSSLRTWFPFYDDLVKLWDGIKAFFVNPFDWLLEHFTDWFLGKE